MKNIIFILIMLICTFSPIIFPLLGIYAISNNIISLIIICIAVSLLYIKGMIDRESIKGNNPIIRYLIFLVFEFIFLMLKEEEHPILLSIVILPFFDMLWVIAFAKNNK